MTAVKDPVCGMTIERADAAASSEHDGTTHYFCSERCKKAFDSDPASFV